VTDFLNPVVREKKRFENLLDDSVAKGLNAGIEVLMNQVCIFMSLAGLAGSRLFQVDHIITALTPPRTYYPPEEAPLLLGPSKGCTEAIKCLEEHIRLLQGNVNREVLEVFEGEVGVRLIG
jgi:recyclin-1